MIDTHNVGETPLEIPDDLIIPQFFLDTHRSQRSIRNEQTTCLIAESTGKRVDIEELHVRATGLANTLKLRWEIGEGDVVAILSPNHVDYLVVVWAVHMLGGIIMASDPSFSTTEDLVSSLRIAAASFLFIHPDFLSSGITAAGDTHITADRIVIFDPENLMATHISYPTLGNLITNGTKLDPQFTISRLGPGEARSRAAFLSFSSGTSGVPKATAISHYAVVANVIQRAVHNHIEDNSIPYAEQRFRPGDVSAAVIPFSHIYGIVNLHFMIFCGMSAVIVPKFDFQGFLQTIVRHQMTHLFLVPAQAVLLCKNPMYKNHDLGCVRFCVIGTAPLPTDLGLDLLRVFPNASLVLSYGLTETCTTVSMTLMSQTAELSGSVGQLLPGISARVTREDGSIAGKGESGELWITGPAMATAYASEPTATKEVFVDGWVRTGDEVYFDDNGELHVVDRLKEIFKVRGFQVSPAELETHLLKHPDICDVCVVGVPDDYSGEVPLAYVALHATAAARVKVDTNETKKLKISILKHVAATKPNHKWIAGGIEFVDALPRDSNGKLSRQHLREQAREVRSRPVARVQRSTAGTHDSLSSRQD